MDTKINITYYVPKEEYVTIDLNKLYNYLAEKVNKVDDPKEYVSNLINYFDENAEDCLYFANFYDIYELDCIDDIVDQVTEKLIEYIKGVLNVR